MTRATNFGLAWTFLLLACGCGGAGGGASGPAVPTAGSARGPAGTPEAAQVEGPSGAPKEELPWAELTPALFAKAKAERKYVVMDGSAEWCHWCHVMEATTYHDPSVRALLDKHFLAAKVDVDTRPDIQERYGDYGWPATVIFSPDAEEIGKYKGYISPEDFAEILKTVVSTSGGKQEAARADKTPASTAPLSEETLTFVAGFTEAELDDYYDTDQGGWGRSQKAAVAVDNAWLLHRVKAGDESRRKPIVFTLDQQRKLLDPVWGGIYQYSAASDWDHAHFEKLMTFQAGALENYATAYAVLKEPRFLEDAKGVRRYIDAFLKGPEGGFFATQDADLNAHERGKTYMTGHAYYVLGDKERRALGIPRVDTHEYGRENGLAIAAYVTFADATGDKTALDAASKAAARILATHLQKNGTIAHTAEGKEDPPYLADNAAFGFGLMRLHEATGKAEYLAAATRIADALVKEMSDKERGGLFATAEDPRAVGIFKTRRKPFEDNVMAVRFLAKVAKATKVDTYKKSIGSALRYVSAPEMVKSRGRWLGDLLLALEETKTVR